MVSDTNGELSNVPEEPTDEKVDPASDPKKEKEDKKKLQKEQKDKEKEEKRRSKLMEKSSKFANKHDEDSLNSGAMLLQVQKIGSEADLSEADKKQSDKKANNSDKAAKKSGPTMLTKVMLLDGTDYETAISRNATGKDLVDCVCEHLNLLEKDYFSCTFRQSDHKVWIDHDKSIMKQLGKSPWVFAFELKFYPPDPTALREEITRYQVYLQVRVDALAGRLPCSFVTHAVLGSLATQSQLGDYDVDAHGSGYEYLKGIRFAPGQTEDLLERIAELHKTHRGESPAEAEMYYLGNAKKFALYGVHLHPTKNSNGEETQVGVCAQGLVIYQNTLRVKRYTWPRIINIAYKRNNFIIQVRPELNPQVGGKKASPATEVYRLPNVKLAKRLWKLAAEHHTFFRLREPEKADTRGIFWRRSYHFAGHTQYQALQASDQYNRPEGEAGHVNRATGGRFTDRLRSVDLVEPAFSTERSEETMDYRTMTLDLKRRNKSSKPFDGADYENQSMGEDGTMYNGGGGGGMYNGTGTYNPNDPESRGLYPITDASGRVVYMKKSEGSIGSQGDVFMTLPGQKKGGIGAGEVGQDGYPSQDDYRGTLGDRRSQVNFISPGGAGEGGIKYGKTPYPGGPGYITPSGPDYNEYTNLPGQGLLGPPDMYGNRLGSDGSAYGPPGYYGSDDWLKQQGFTGQGDDQLGGDYTGGYGTGSRDGPRRDSKGNLLTSVNITLSGARPNGGDDSDGVGMFQDDHLNQEGLRGGPQGQGQWTGTFSTSIKTTSRTYTAPDGTLVTEHRTEKDGVVETHIERRKTLASMEEELDYDRALRDAIKSVTDMSDDLTVEKIEIETKSQDGD